MISEIKEVLFLLDGSQKWAFSAIVETITSFESWRQNLKYVLSLDANFAAFLVDGFEWDKKTRAAPLRGFVDDGADVPAAQRRTANQKTIHLELMRCLDRLPTTAQWYPGTQ